MCADQGLKIAYYAPHFPYRDTEQPRKQFLGGGMEHTALQIALHMAQRGHEVTVFTTTLSGQGSQEQYAGIKVYRCKANLVIASAPIALGLFRRPPGYRADIVHAHLAVPTAALVAWYQARRQGVPLVLNYHGDLQDNFGSPVRRLATFAYNALVHRKLLAAARVIIPHTKYDAERSRFLCEYQQKLEIIPSGIDPADFDLPISRAECRGKLGLPIAALILLFVGWLSPHKGPDVLMRALPRLVRKFPQTLAVFMGTGDLHDKLLALSRELGVEQAIKFVGYVTDIQQKALYYRAADIFVLPSTTTAEVFGVVNLEAMASGLPIVASDIGGVPEVVRDGENGLLVPSKDPEALAQALLRLLGDEGLRLRLAQQGRQMVQKYTWPTIVERIERIYFDLAQRHGS